MCCDTLTEEKNLFYFPVFNDNKLSGVIEINFDKILQELDNNFLYALRISMLQISSEISGKNIKQKPICTYSVSECNEKHSKTYRNTV